MKNESRSFLWVAFCCAVSLPVLADPNALRVDAEGNVGVGTAEPTAKLHVAGDGNPRIFVEDTSGVNKNRRLFEIAGSGNPKFAVTNIAKDVTWAFANPGEGFRLSRLGSGSIEFEVKNNGDAVLAGSLIQNSDVDAKRDIEALDQQIVLAKVMELPVSEWSYKDSPSSRHIGPMAQDFYKSFGLGSTDKGLSSIDTGGVALAAIQGIKKEKDSEVEQLRADLKRQEHRVMELELLVRELLRKQS